MSTFNGYLPEFPLIRIDHFRTLPGKVPPLACFLSHVHSDHLMGLESLKSPFVYCSSATRELLLRLEKYPHRMNFAKGILECRIQTYKHLRKLLKPLPLDTPIQMELCSGNDIQVTLFDANHCVGSVMFLIEGQGSAVLYTGDIRSEPWWVNALTRNPILLPYATGIRKLDTLYLDTTFAVKSDPYRNFPSKSEGIAELLTKVEKYSKYTAFYLNSWTFGYEDVWIALSNALHSPIHLDRYRYSLYTSLARTTELGGISCRETPSLGGFKLGNSNHPGILTQDPGARIHSCEKGSGCRVLQDRKNLVEITPIISRHEGVEMLELGAGGGKGDLNQSYELELANSIDVQELLRLCTSMTDQDPAVARESMELVQRLSKANETSVPLDDVATFLDEMKSGLSNITGAIPLNRLPQVLARLSTSLRQDADETSAALDLQHPSSFLTSAPRTNSSLPTSITFPYSRHSSYAELRALVAALTPRAVYPCVAPPPSEWHEDMSMASLFGDLCAGTKSGSSKYFLHDEEMRASRAEQEMDGERGLKRKRTSSQPSRDTTHSRDVGRGAGEAESNNITQDKSSDADESETGYESAMEALEPVKVDSGSRTSSPKGSKSSAHLQSSAEAHGERNSKLCDGDVEICNSAEPRPSGPGAQFTCPATIATLSKSAKEEASLRLQARRDAYEAAREGTWHTIELASLGLVAPSAGSAARPGYELDVELI